jgi:hypothetical protein
MEFLSVEGNNHIIEPIGYNMVRKRIKKGKMLRSAGEQYEIHRVATEFRSSCLCIPPPGVYESPTAYTMMQIYECRKISPDEYFPRFDLYLDLCNFKNFMLERGFMPRDFFVMEVFPNKYTLLDFSRFGIIAGGQVRFPKDPRKYTLLDAEVAYGLYNPPTPVYKAAITAAQFNLTQYLEEDIEHLSLDLPPLSTIMITEEEIEDAQF